MLEKRQNRLAAVSDKAAAFIVPTMRYLLGMESGVAPYDEDWSLEEVERNVRGDCSVVLLVMHPGDYRDNVLQCGPRVSKALEVSDEIRKPKTFLVPVEMEAAILTNPYVDLVIRLHSGELMATDKALASSDVRLVLALMSAVEIQNASTP